MDTKPGLGISKAHPNPLFLQLSPCYFICLFLLFLSDFFSTIMFSIFQLPFIYSFPSLFCSSFINLLFLQSSVLPLSRHPPTHFFIFPVSFFVFHFFSPTFFFSILLTFPFPSCLLLNLLFSYRLSFYPFPILVSCLYCYIFCCLLLIIFQ